jgi:hypothetical protein
VVEVGAALRCVGAQSAASSFLLLDCIPSPGLEATWPRPRPRSFILLPSRGLVEEVSSVPRPRPLPRPRSLEAIGTGRSSSVRTRVAPLKSRVGCSNNIRPASCWQYESLNSSKMIICSPLHAPIQRLLHFHPGVDALWIPGLSSPDLVHQGGLVVPQRRQ